MCIACEMGFWMAMEEPQQSTAFMPAGKVVRVDESFACDTPEIKAPKRVVRRKSSQGKSGRGSAVRKRERKP